MFTPFAFIQPFVVAIAGSTAAYYNYVVGNFGSFNAPTFNNILATDLSGSIDTTFNMGIGFNSTVRCMATQSDGKILVGGDFTTYSGSANNYFIRLNANGTKDTTFTPTINNSVYTTSVQSDGKIVIGGAFTTVNAVTTPRLARLNTDGTRDTTWNPGTAGANSIVRDLKIQSDGKIVAVGDFITYSGSATAIRIVRTENSGTIDTTFNTGTTGLNNTSYNCHIQSDGKILATGIFTTYSGSANTNDIVRINTNGTKDTTFNPGTTGFNGAVNASKLLPDGKLIAVGAFTTYSGSTSNYICMVNSNGTRDTTFNVGAGLNASWGGGLNNGISYDTANNLYLASDNVSYSGSTVPRIFKIKPNGTLDTTYESGVGLNRFAIANLISGSILYTGGTFTSYKAPGATGVTLLSNSATISSSFNPGISSPNAIQSICKQSDSKVILAGTNTLTTYSGSTVAGMWRVNTNGTIDSTFKPGTGFNGLPYDMYTQTDDKIVIGGTFTTYSGSSTSTTRLMRINPNGTQDLIYRTGTGLNQYTTRILVRDSGAVVAAGFFTTYSGSSANFIVQTNSDGTRDNTFNIGAGFNNNVNTAATQSDGKLIVGGDFTTYSGSATVRLVRINTDGTKDTTFNIGGAHNATVNAVAVQSDGKIIVGGAFTSYSGSASNRLMRINTNGSKDTTFNVGTGLSAAPSNNGITIGPDGIIYCIGTFFTYSGSTSNGIVAVNTDGTINQTFNAGIGTASFNSTGRGFTYNQAPLRIIPA